MTDFLYPFIEADERDVDALITDLEASARAKTAESSRLRAGTCAELGPQLDDAAAAMAERFDRGGRLFTFGNGGSSTDAAGLADLFNRPPAGAPVPARCLAEDAAVLTALGNDVGFDLVFSRQLIAHGRPDDIALGFSTSGSSRNLMEAFAEARRQGMATIGLAGYAGGEMAQSGEVQHCLVVASDSVHRIQEAQAAVSCDLWARVSRLLDRTPVRVRERSVDG